MPLYLLCESTIHHVHDKTCQEEKLVAQAPDEARAMVAAYWQRKY